MEGLEFKAVILTGASKVMSKSNGGQYVLHTAQITEGALKGQKVTATRTILNKDGEEKAGVNQNDEVILYCNIVADAEGKRKPFFEISSKIDVADDATILAMLAQDVPQEGDQKLG